MQTPKVEVLIMWPGEIKDPHNVYKACRYLSRALWPDELSLTSRIIRSGYFRCPMRAGSFGTSPGECFGRR